ncbi:MAG TPA: DEAD/DEAH box helicase [Acidimicrobiales bacterium]|nr:DEAD/DEAH box helicase [Acidimicrobiales bacterium]
MPPTFAELGVSADLCAVLEARGITTAFPIQEMSIPDGLAGRDICGKAKTGSGKTLAFGIPVIEQIDEAEPGRPTAIALVPTRELAVQVRDELAPLAECRGLTVEAIYGGADIEKQIQHIKRGLDFVVATPGRMIDLIERKEVTVEAVSHIVIDEADRMADMGFMPQVEWILRNAKAARQSLLFSATLDGAVDGLVQRYQTDPVIHEVVSPTVTVEGMIHRFIQVHQMDKPKVAAAIVRNSSRTLLFSRTKRGADRLAEQLNKEGVKAAAIHGDLRQTAREKALADFSAGKLPALVATDVAARGIHVDDVDVVVHFDPPEDHKTYLHRSGRTARAGEPGLVVTLVLWDQELEVKRMQKRIGIDLPLVEMFSNDKRLTDLAAWDPTSVPA